MKSHRFRHDSLQDKDQPRSQTSLRLKRGALVLLAFMIIGVVIAFAPNRKDANQPDHVAGVTHNVNAQNSPLATSLSAALNSGAAAERRADPTVVDPGASDQRNLLRVALVIAGVLLVTVIVWRQR